MLVKLASADRRLTSHAARVDKSARTQRRRQRLRSTQQGSRQGVLGEFKSSPVEGSAGTAVFMSILRYALPWVLNSRASSASAI